MQTARARGGETAIGGALALFVLGGAVGVWASYDRALSWPTFFTLAGSIGLCLVVARLSGGVRWAAQGLVVAAGLLALYFVGQYGHLDYQAETGLPAQLGRFTGAALPAWTPFKPHPNAVATFLEGALLVGVVIARRGRGGTRLAWGAATALIGYALFVSDSRGAWVGIGVAALGWLWLRFPGRGRQGFGAAAGVTVGVAAGAMVVWSLAGPGEQIPLLSSIFNTANSRFVLYRNSLYLLRDYPFTGLGLGSAFAMVYSRYQLLINVPYLYYAHNLFLSVWLGQGVLGLLALVWLLVGFYRFVAGVERTGLAGEGLSLFRAAWLGATATFVHGLTDSAQFSGAYWTMPVLFVLVGLALATGRSAAAPPVRVGWKGAAAGGAALVALAVVFWRPLGGAWFANRGALVQTWADLSPEYGDGARRAMQARATADFLRAQTLSPGLAVADRRLGLLALDRNDFETAVTHLERAFSAEPENQATLKGLGYAYLWAGEVDLAVARFEAVEFRSRLLGELGYWRWWWGTQNRPDLAGRAGEALERLAGAG
ncbi:MAG: O-antigen ligase family protein [Anaerolineae bacterium]